MCRPQTETDRSRRTSIVSHPLKPVLILLSLSLTAAAPNPAGRPASPASHPHHVRSLHARAPAAAQSGRPTALPGHKGSESAAPVPNEQVAAPAAPEESRTHVTPTLFDLGMSYQGDGYPYGSSPQAMDDRRSAHVPGISLKVPLR
jgi:hypothetical protein